MHDGDEEELPEPPTSLIRLQPGRQVVDVDEEIFLLYTLQARAQHDGGLGYVNHGSDQLWVAIDGSRWSSDTKDGRDLSGSIVLICQDVTSLRSSRGNTGSVLWRSTVLIAIQILQDRLLDLSALRSANVLELGSGTGALPAFIAPLSHTWLATDQAELVPLMDKNTRHLANCHTAALDWYDFLTPSSAHQAQLGRSAILNHFDNAQYPDLIVCCDCVYNPALFPALIATLNAFTKPAHTVVLLSCEMRSNETMADFLAAWLHDDPLWRLVSLQDRFDKGFVVFAAWKTSIIQRHFHSIENSQSNNPLQ